MRTHFVNAIKEARRFIARRPEDDNARILASLVLALESDRSFELITLYQLDYKSFDLAIEVLREWRLDRYFASKAKLLDLSLQVDELSRLEDSVPAGAPPDASAKPAKAARKASA